MKSVPFENETVVPSKIVCVGRNYVEHIEELGNEVPERMVLFCKPNSAISDAFGYFTPDTRFEGEICLLMGSEGIEGIGFGFDLTHAHIQNELKRKGLPWERAKAFDGSAVFSDFVRAPDDLSSIGFRLRRNGILVQEARYDHMIYKPETVIEEIRRFMTLEKGDIVMTGTPKGVSPYAKGDRFRVELFDGDAILLQKEWSVKA
ncbi:fumarylacetoacetate hydrolase family protein [Hydrogenimonas urashimensis]|uniref:fumarylacetoacetate hydrolase family protein n=1 Tax=Hydrogenimonas urashimensis TaxID=2740515 RepID=UPI0019162068|nr:fumarylacetoacetate hydrolase family protein [Hydrogenimonas urashimensis]